MNLGAGNFILNRTVRDSPLLPNPLECFALAAAGKLQLIFDFISFVPRCLTERMSMNFRTEYLALTVTLCMLLPAFAARAEGGTESYR